MTAPANGEELARLMRGDSFLPAPPRPSRELRRLRAEHACLTAGLRPNSAIIKAMAEMTVTEQAELLSHWKAGTLIRRHVPRSARPAAPADGKELARLIRD